MWKFIRKCAIIEKLMTKHVIDYHRKSTNLGMEITEISKLMQVDEDYDIIVQLGN